MAEDTQSKQASPVIQAHETPMPKYEYQQDDSRSFGVSFQPADAKVSSANCTTTLKIF
jgi:hypothetical protein